MEFKHLLIIVIICGIIYYLYRLINKTPQPQPIKTPITQEPKLEDQIKPIIPIQEIILPTPYIDPYINPYYDPYYYPFWDPYDLYPYGIIGVDAGADWNSTYNVVTHGYNKRRNKQNRRDKQYRRGRRDKQYRRERR